MNRILSNYAKAKICICDFIIAMLSPARDKVRQYCGERISDTAVINVSVLMRFPLLFLMRNYNRLIMRRKELSECLAGSRCFRKGVLRSVLCHLVCLQAISFCQIQTQEAFTHTIIREFIS